MEYLQDATCRQCSFLATLESLSTEIKQLKQKAKKTKDLKKKKDRITESVRLERVRQEIEDRFKTGRLEEEDEQDRLPLKSTQGESSKQVMLAKPPKILCLHISRSAFLNTGAIYKNTCQILFPEYLDVSAFSTNGTLHTQPNVPISTPISREKSQKQYRLMSIIVHYGSHSFGHFVAFKRRIYTDQCQCFECQNRNDEVWHCQEAWYRISDSKVDPCSLEDVLRSNPYMLLYELVDKDEEEDTIETKQDHIPVVLSSSDYNNIPMDNASKEALRIANSLLNINHADEEDELLAAKL